jgi:hypothetical protein
MLIKSNIKNIKSIRSLVSIQDLNRELSLLLLLITAAKGFAIVSRIISLGRNLVNHPLKRSLVNQPIPLRFKDNIRTAVLGIAAL